MLNFSFILIYIFSFLISLSSCSYGFDLSPLNFSMPSLDDFYFSKFNVSDLCAFQRLQYIDVNQNLFAWMLLHYDECLAIGENDGVSFRGKYCVSKVTIPGKETIKKMNPPMLEEMILNSIAVSAIKLSQENPVFYIYQDFLRKRNEDIYKTSITLPLSICYPEGCSVEDIISTLNIEFNTIFNEEIFHFDLAESSCEIKEDIQLTLADWAVIGYFVFFGIIVAVCTSFDLYNRYYQKETKNLKLIAFSWYTNFKKLISIKSSPEQFESIDGIRCLSLTWIIIGHVYMHYGTYVHDINIQSSATFSKDYMNMFIIGANFAVESYFFISGFLLMYGFLKHYTKTNTFNLLMFYLNRYLRLTLPLIGVVAFYATILPYFGSGPNWSGSCAILQQGCKTYWWSSLLYIQNYVNPLEICIGPTWYLQVDAQLYFISPIILLSLVWYPRAGKVLLGTLSVLGFIVPVLMFYLYDLHLDPLVTISPFNEDFRQYYYEATYARAESWILGLIFGYFMFHNKIKIRINNVVVLLLWIVSLTTLCLSIILHQPFLQGENNFGSLISGFYFAFTGLFWCIALGWIIYATTHGYGGPITFILHLNIWKVFTRCSYSIFLIHFVVIYIGFATMRTEVYFNNYQMFGYFCASTVISIVISIPWALTFEMPLSVLLSKTKAREVYSNNRAQSILIENNTTKPMPPIPNAQLFNNTFNKDIAIIGHNFSGNFNVASVD